MPVLIRPQIGVQEVIVTAPSGEQWRFEATSSTPLPFAETTEPGIYTVEQQTSQPAGAQAPLRTTFAVNLFSELESTIEPRDEINVAQSQVSAQSVRNVGRREWWRWPALAALGILLIEWIVHLYGRLPVSLRELFTRHIPFRDEKPRDRTSTIRNV
jgi:hypothetical protein